MYTFRVGGYKTGLFKETFQKILVKCNTTSKYCIPSQNFPPHYGPLAIIMEKSSRTPFP